MMQIANILPGQWRQHMLYRYGVWAHRLSRAVAAEIKKLPEQPPPLPWPVQKKPVNELRANNGALFPKFPAKPKRRPYSNTYVPRTIDLDAARTEVYRPMEKDEDWLWKIKFCWDEPHPWSIEAVVDPGGNLYLPFFRQVTIRLGLKAKICRELNAKKDGRWVGECNGGKKLNLREPIGNTTQWIMENGQGIRKPMDNGQWTVDSAGHQATGSSPAAHGSLLTAHSTPGASPGVAAYRAKMAEHERRRAEQRKPPRRRIELPPFREVFGLGPWPLRYESCDDFVRREQEREQLVEIEREVMQGLFWSMPSTVNPTGPGFLSRDDFDGYLLTRQELGPDHYDYDWPRPRSAAYLVAKWKGRRKPKRYATVRDRLTKVKPAARIVPTGKRSAELVITRRLHELSFGLQEALNLARMVEGAIKYRDPVKPDRKQSWRQQLRSTIVHRPGLLTWLVRNPIDTLDNGKWVVENRKQQLLDLGPVDPVAARRTYPYRATLTELFPEAGLPKHYLQLVDRGWVTAEGDLFAATPGGDFATTVEGFRLRLPLAVMPAATYDRWRAQGGNHRRRRGQARRKRPRRGCYCYFRPPNLRTLAGAEKAQVPLFLRN